MPANIHYSGKLVQYATPPKRTQFFEEGGSTNRDHKTKTYKMDRRNKQKIFDAATYQNTIASMDNKLSHTFFTLTYPTNQSGNATKDIGKFMYNLKRHSERVYPEIKDRYSYIWVREITQKNEDHFHVMAVLPVFRLKESKHEKITHSIPFYYDGEQDSKFFSLNKAWCKVRGYYSKNAVRVSKDRSGKSLFTIDNLQSAIRYVSKYVTKGQTDSDGNLVASSKPVVRMSENLKEWTVPLKIDSVVGLMYDNFWCESFKFVDKKTGEVIEKRVIETDYAKIGKVKLQKAAMLYTQMQQELLKAEIKKQENALMVVRNIQKNAEKHKQLQKRLAL